MTENGLQTQTDDRKPQPLTRVWRQAGRSASFDAFLYI